MQTLKEKKRDLTHYRPRNDNYKTTEATSKYSICLIKLLIDNWKRLALNNYKFNMPECVKQDKREFLDDSDSVKSFIMDTVETTNNKSDFIKSKELYNLYKIAMKEQSEKTIKLKDFKTRCNKLLEFKAQAKINKKNHKGVYIKCVLVDNNDDDDDELDGYGF